MVERSTDGGTHWSAVATVNFPPSAFTCQGVSAAWLGFTYGEHGGQGAVAGTTDGGRTWGTSARPVPDSAVLIPGSPANGRDGCSHPGHLPVAGVGTGGARWRPRRSFREYGRRALEAGFCGVRQRVWHCAQQ